MNKMSDIETLAMQAYERGRVRIGLAAAGWIVLFAAFLCTLSAKPVFTATIGIVLAAVTGFAAFKGRMIAGASRSGILAGLIPASLALSARELGHACSIGGMCLSWCMLGCAAGGIAAAVIIVRRAGRWQRSPAYWYLASLSMFATASLACSCAGFTSLIALAVGFVMSIFPAKRLLILPA